MEHNVIDSSLKSILRVTIPMLITLMGENFMYVIDRFMLAGYSMDSMNAVMLAGNFVSIFTIMFMGIANSAEIFVGQYNGSEQYEKLAAPTWQMIYMSVGAGMIGIFMAVFSEYLNPLFPSYYMKDGVAYLRILMFFIVFPPLRASISAFFIGQGKTKIISVSITVGVTLNLILDYLLIYGVGNIVPRMGAEGAAIATVVSEFVQGLILTVVFFSKSNRKIFKTLKNCKFQKKLFWDCLRVGTPLSLGNFASLLAWYLLQSFVSFVSQDMATIYSIGSNLYVLFMFAGEGMQKSMASIAANMIARRDLEAIRKTWKIFVMISIFFGLIITLPLTFCSDWIFKILSMLPDDISGLYSEIRIVLYIAAVDVCLENILLVMLGLLAAGGDTKYSIAVNQTCLWVLVMIPCWIMYCTHTLTSVPVIYGFIAVWPCVSFFFVYRRYKSLKWYNKLV